MSFKRLTCLTGLGNPEPQYAFTRHNVGVMLLDMLGATLGKGEKPHYKQSSASALVHYTQTPPGEMLGPMVLLRSDGGFMNCSGVTLRPVWRALARQAPSGGPNAINHIVLHDELSLPIGKAQLRPHGRSCRGHNGLRDLERQMPGVEFKRLAIGIGRPESHDPQEVAAYVLGKFTADEQELLRQRTLPRVLELLRNDAKST